MLCAPHGCVLGSTWEWMMSYFLMTSPIFLWMGGWVHVTLTPTLISTLKLHVGISKSFGKFDTVSCVSKY
jgi:hypothetical protein